MSHLRLAQFGPRPLLHSAAFEHRPQLSGWVNHNTTAELHPCTTSDPAYIIGPSGTQPQGQPIKRRPHPPVIRIRFIFSLCYPWSPSGHPKPASRRPPLISPYGCAKIPPALASVLGNNQFWPILNVKPTFDLILPRQNVNYLTPCTMTTQYWMSIGWVLRC